MNRLTNLTPAEKKFLDDNILKFKQNNIKAANMEKQKMEQADKAHKDCMGF